MQTGRTDRGGGKLRDPMSTATDHDFFSFTATPAQTADPEQTCGQNIDDSPTTGIYANITASRTAGRSDQVVRRRRPTPISRVRIPHTEAIRSRFLDRIKTSAPT